MEHHSIAREQRDAERKKREWMDDEKAISMARKRLKVEATQVSLGERDEVSKDVITAQWLRHTHREGTTTTTSKTSSSMMNPNPLMLMTTMNTQPFPRVREPPGGYVQERSLTRESYLRRQVAGGGIKSGSTTFFERNWNIAVSSLFRKHHVT